MAFQISQVYRGLSDQSGVGPVFQISQVYRCARIEGLDSLEGLEGLLLFGREHFYVVDGLTLLRSKQIADIDSLPTE